ncbi:MAG TPA: ribonuclease PH [Chloroflexota bacterium]|nr:ribonuclease PH [Chloroflexota bacterium]
MADMRHDGRKHDQLRPVSIEPGFMPYAEGSVLYVQGNTRVICAASVEESVPGFLRGKGKGWVTAEYRMLPRATDTRTAREPDRGQLSGRTQEIQRLIGRALRAVVDFEALGERTIIVDCDVIQADGGTRTASITGAYVALVLAIRNLMTRDVLARTPITGAVAAVSVGIVDGQPMLDLDYSEDSRAEVDVNVAMTDAGKFVEIQGTAESQPFDRGQTDELLTLAEQGIGSLLTAQRDALAR